MPTQADLNKRFNYHRPDEAKAQRHQRIRDAHRALADVLDEELIECREQSLALTKIEEAMFWANAAIARE